MFLYRPDKKNTTKTDDSKLRITSISPNSETKSESENTQYLGYRSSFRDGWNWLTDTMAWNFYKQASPVASAIDLTAQEFANLDIGVLDVKDKKFISDTDKRVSVSKELDLLNNPSTGITGIEFRTSILTSYLATGDCYVYVTALNENSEPKEIFYINPIDIEIMVDYDGYVSEYRYTRYGGTIVFKRSGTKDFRYFAENGTKELWHIRKFNPDKTASSADNTYKGLSPLHPIYLEIDSYVESYLHNKNMLKNGQRLSAMFLAEKNLSRQQYASLQTQIKTEIQGAQNNGEIIILEGIEESGLKFVPLSEVSKDIDYKQLIDNTRQQIDRQLKIPAPLTEMNSQKFDNFTSALAVFYRMTVLPLAKIFYTELNMFLAPRYKDSDKYKIWYDKTKVDVLEATELNNSLKKMSSNRLTDNEGRRLLGYEDIEGGDVITRDQRPTLGLTPTVAESKSIPENINNKNRLEYILQNQYNTSGDKLFSDVEIKKMVEKFNGSSQPH
jgi:HK97 family phage portal protein